MEFKPNSPGCSSEREIDNTLEEGKARIFKWKIEGFSTLEKHRKLRHPHHSGIFEAGGYEWKPYIVVNPNYISLYLQIVYPYFLPDDMVVNTAFNLCVYDQIHGNHLKKKATHKFRTTSITWGFMEMIPLKRFKNPSSGFLVSDSCIFGIEMMKVHPQTLQEQVFSQCDSLKKEIVSHVYTWKIKHSEALKKLCVASEAFVASEVFVAGGFKWNLKIYVYGSCGSNYLSIYLELNDHKDIPLNSAVLVDCALSTKDQLNGKDKIFNGTFQFESRKPMYGWAKFMSCKDFEDPSKGFLVNDVCIIEASVAFVGRASFNK